MHVLNLYIRESYFGNFISLALFRRFQLVCFTIIITNAHRQIVGLDNVPKSASKLENFPPFLLARVKTIISFEEEQNRAGPKLGQMYFFSGVRVSLGFKKHVKCCSFWLPFTPVRDIVRPLLYSPLRFSRST